MPIEFTKSSQDFESYLKSNKVLVANFTAAWCGPCQQIKPVVDKAYDTFSNVEIVRVDLDRQEELAHGTEKTRVSGANVQQLLTNLDTFNAKASGATRKGNGKAAAASLLLSSKSYKEIRPLIPSGFEILNSSIDFGSFEALNVKSVYKNKEVKSVFKAGEEEERNGNGNGNGKEKDATSSTVISESDSQILFAFSLLNISKIYSILIKVNRHPKRENIGVDEDDLDEIQLPNMLKVWPNLPNILSFEDATGDSNAPHSESLRVADIGAKDNNNNNNNNNSNSNNSGSSNDDDDDDDETNGEWIEAKLKYVKFQNVQSLCLFFDGEDEDYHTVIEKVLIIGVNGESKEQKTLGSLEPEEE
ncbi:Thioredoxin-like protein 1 [Lodderomyces elongisporus]|uniref:Thioredoxin-like protein 1 n=1 Tax=Lodderomyces elongisporus TaxID=36914 RepID=UPI0029239EB6|nr:Thioredoxin-like protein 1 [Lodderomyces elongisporus]WLF77657.1 Thioredoxin-like protein 1 [Lodderomyces elongisporus]